MGTTMLRADQAPPTGTAGSLSAPAAALPRHSALVRVTHWIITLCFIALLVSGGEIVISHPRFYWGESGTVLTEPLFKIPIPASRNLVPTGYGYVLPDQNGWSRALHFQTAWILVLTGILYVIVATLSGHFRKDLLPLKGDLSWKSLANVVRHHVRFESASDADAWSYNVLQRITYLSVIFILFPLAIWTGLALSPALDSAFPGTVNLLGGRQSARTLHFFISLALLLFLVLHVGLVWRAGFVSRMRAMITGRINAPKGHR